MMAALIRRILGRAKSFAVDREMLISFILNLLVIGFTKLNCSHILYLNQYPKFVECLCVCGQMLRHDDKPFQKTRIKNDQPVRLLAADLLSKHKAIIIVTLCRDEKRERERESQLIVV